MLWTYIWMEGHALRDSHSFWHTAMVNFAESSARTRAISGPSYYVIRISREDVLRLLPGSPPANAQPAAPSERKMSRKPN